MNAPFPSADLATARPVYPDWRDRADVAALLDSFRAYPPQCVSKRDSTPQRLDECIEYAGHRVDLLRDLYSKELRRARDDSDAGNRVTGQMLWECDPASAREPRPVPSILRDSSPVDRIIYEAIEGGANGRSYVG